MITSISMLKLGDKIVIIDSCNSNWNVAMDKFLGQTVTIDKIEFSSNVVRLKEDNRRWAWNNKHINWIKTNELYNKPNEY